MEGDYLEYAESPVRIEGLPPFPFHLKIEPPQRGRMEELFREIGTAWRRTPGEPLLILRAKAGLVELVYLLRKQLDSPNLPAEPAALERFRRFVEQNFASDIMRRDAAAAAGISESHLTALLIRYRSSNFSDYLNRVRLKAAAELLQYSTLSVKEVAAATGFRSSSYFVARFRERYGIPRRRSEEWQQREDACYLRDRRRRSDRIRCYDKQRRVTLARDHSHTGRRWRGCHSNG